MISELYEGMKEALKEIPAFANSTEVREYRGEYASDQPWNPAFPNCYIQFAGSKPKVEARSGYAMRSSFGWLLYFGAKVDPIGDTYDLLEDIIAKLDGITFHVSGQGSKKCKVGVIDTLGKTNSIWVHTIEVEFV